MSVITESKDIAVTRFTQEMTDKFEELLDEAKGVKIQDYQAQAVMDHILMIYRSRYPSYFTSTMKAQIFVVQGMIVVKANQELGQFVAGDEG